MRWSCMCLVGVACGASPDQAPPVIDAYGGPIGYQVNVVPAEPQGRPAPVPAPEVYIDGVATEHVELSYPSLNAAVAATHLVELRAGGRVIAGKTVWLARDECVVAGTTLVAIGLCEFDSGDLRMLAQDVQRGTGPCSDDYFCDPACPCTTDERCTERVVATSPTFSHLGCAPIGPHKLGEPCTFVADPAGAYDDCGADLSCVDGTCKAICGSGAACAACSYVAGYPPELQVCM